MTTGPREGVLPACSACGGESTSEGFIEDRGEASGGYLRWIPGALERGIFGGAKVAFKQRVPIAAWMCARCGHLDLYAMPG